MADLDVVCFTGLHMQYVIYAVGFIVVYPFGVPVGTLVALTCLRGPSAVCKARHAN